MSQTRKVIDSGSFYIKPAANHILTVGKGIIKDSSNAILELVKNAYDADASLVTVQISIRNKLLTVTVQDDGHGMSYQTVTQKWMVPSNTDKIRQKRSLLKQRPLQGRKGIGRYAASILGKDILLKTTDQETLVTTELYINWLDFETDAKFLEDVDILIESYQAEAPQPGTLLIITGDKEWSDKEFDDLASNLRRLLSPFDDIEADFRIILKIDCDTSEKYASFNEQIRPTQILEHYHYRVHGKIGLSANDKGENNELVADLTLENRHLNNILPIQVNHNFHLPKDEKFCGNISLDIRVFDLDENLPGNNTSSYETRQQLKELPGIAILRDGFRVRPYGDKKVDWLGLNERRYNNPTKALSSNQVAGFVTVLQEDESHLEEKATREGFKEDEHYDALRRCILECLLHVEQLRYRFRRQFNKGTRVRKDINQQIQEATDFEVLKQRVAKVLNNANVSEPISLQIKEIIQAEAKEKAEQFEEIKQTIAQYEGQVTLGKIMTVVFHEGRKPLNALRHHPKFISEWIKEFEHSTKDNPAIDQKGLRGIFRKIIDRLNDNKTQAEIFTQIFKKLEPLAQSKRPPRSDFPIAKPILHAFRIFESELTEQKIAYSITDPDDLVFHGWEIDFLITFANLIENSIFWMKDAQQRKIDVEISASATKLTIDYADSGTGIDEISISDQDIFEPGVSTKPFGTGLGLAIAGEAIARNNGKIRAVSSALGANFLIELPYQQGK